MTLYAALPVPVVVPITIAVPIAMPAAPPAPAAAVAVVGSSFVWHISFFVRRVSALVAFVFQVISMLAGQKEKFRAVC